jgi:hypothetical protein
MGVLATQVPNQASLRHNEEDQECLRCHREIEGCETLIRAGHPDVEGLCRALADWGGELRLIRQELGLSGATALARK